MNRFFQAVGIAATLTGVLYGGYYLFTHYQQLTTNFFFSLGVLTFGGLLLFLFIRLLFGKNWKWTAPTTTIFGTGLIQATTKLIQEGKTKLALKDFIGFLDEIKEIDKSARIIHGNHKELENQKIEGTLEENETTLINKINKRIINLHEELESLIQSRFEVHKIEIAEESFLENR